MGEYFFVFRTQSCIISVFHVHLLLSYLTLPIQAWSELSVFLQELVENNLGRTGNTDSRLFSRIHSILHRTDYRFFLCQNAVINKFCCNTRHFSIKMHCTIIYHSTSHTSLHYTVQQKSVWVLLVCESVQIEIFSSHKVLDTALIET